MKKLDCIRVWKGERCLADICDCTITQFELTDDEYELFCQWLKEYRNSKYVHWLTSANDLRESYPAVFDSLLLQVKQEICYWYCTNDIEFFDMLGLTYDEDYGFYVDGDMFEE